jgi:hypothetical protein
MSPCMVDYAVLHRKQEVEKFENKLDVIFENVTAINCEQQILKESVNSNYQMLAGVIQNQEVMRQ